MRTHSLLAALVLALLVVLAVSGALTVVSENTSGGFDDQGKTIKDQGTCIFLHKKDPQGNCENVFDGDSESSTEGEVQ